MKGKIITLAAALSLAVSSFAQEAAPAAEAPKANHWLVGIKGGVDYLRWSDQKVQPAFGAFVGYSISPLIGLNLEYLYMINNREDAGAQHPAFDGSLQDITLQAKLNLSNIADKYRSECWQKFNVYAIGGAGVSLWKYDAKNFNDSDNGVKPVVLAGLSAEYNIKKVVVGLGADYRFHANNEIVGGFGGRSIATATLSVAYRFGHKNVGSETVKEWEAGYEEAAAPAVQPYDDSALQAKNKELEGRVAKNEADIKKLQGDLKTVKDTLDAYVKKANEKAPAKYTPTKEESKVLETAYSKLEFESGKATIKTTSHTSLNGLADLLKQHHEWSVALNGYTDNTGSADKNLQLSKERADAVKTYLVGKGVSAAAITTNGYGIENPIASNATAAGRTKNRRVEIELFSK